MRIILAAMWCGALVASTSWAGKPGKKDCQVDRRDLETDGGFYAGAISLATPLGYFQYLPDGGMTELSVPKPDAGMTKNAVTKPDNGLLCTLPDGALTLMVYGTAVNTANLAVVDGGITFTTEQPSFLAKRGCDADGRSCRALNVRSEPVQFEPGVITTPYFWPARKGPSTERLPVGAHVPVALTGFDTQSELWPVITVQRPTSHSSPLPKVDVLSGDERVYAVNDTLFFRPYPELFKKTPTPTVPQGWTWSADLALEPNAWGPSLVTHAPAWAPGRTGLAFLAQNHGFALSPKPNAPLPTVTDFTISLWVRWFGTSLYSPEKGQALLGISGRGKKCSVVEVQAGYLQFAHEAGKRAPLEPNEWHHVTVSFNAGKGRLLLDGVVVVEGGPAAPPLAQLVIGGCRTGLVGEGDDAFGIRAYLDDISLFPGTLTEAQLEVVTQQR